MDRNLVSAFLRFIVVVNAAFIALPCAVIAIGLTANRSKNARIGEYACFPNFANSLEPQVMRPRTIAQCLEKSEEGRMKNSG